MKKKTNIFIYIISFLWLFEGLVLFYKKCMSPLMKNACIYHPTCSSYMLQSIKRFKFRGIILGTLRILRCLPWCKGGFDPIPIKHSDYRWLY